MKVFVAVVLGIAVGLMCTLSWGADYQLTKLSNEAPPDGEALYSYTPILSAIGEDGIEVKVKGQTQQFMESTPDEQIQRLNVAIGQANTEIARWTKIKSELPKLKVDNE